MKCTLKRGRVDYLVVVADQSLPNKVQKPLKLKFEISGECWETVTHPPWQVILRTIDRRSYDWDASLSPRYQYDFRTWLISNSPPNEVRCSWNGGVHRGRGEKKTNQQTFCFVACTVCFFLG